DPTLPGEGCTRVGQPTSGTGEPPVRPSREQVRLLIVSPVCCMPERQLCTIPYTELVVYDSQIVFDDVFGCAKFCGDAPVIKSTCDKSDDVVFSRAATPPPIEFWHD